MRILHYYTVFIIFAFLWSNKAFSTTYYISSSGNNNHTGTSTSQAWQSIEKIDTLGYNLKAGDSILFERGASYYGTLMILSSGTIDKPIYIGAYGIGHKPIISGAETLKNWVNTGADLWQTNFATTGIDRVSDLMINGIQQQIGRHPDFNPSDGGFFKITACKGDSVLASTTMGSSNNYTDGEAVIRTNRWILDRKLIKIHRNDSLFLLQRGTYNFGLNYGFFIQNLPSCLNLKNEWCYNLITKTIHLNAIDYNPNSKQITMPSKNYALTMNLVSYITIKDIHFTAAHKSNIYITSSKNISILNCEISNAGSNGAYIYNCPNTIFENNLIYNCNNYGVDIVGDYSVVRNNNVRCIALRQGMGNSGNGTYTGLNLTSRNGLIQYNKIDSIGYIGISFGKDSMRVTNNIVKNTCMAKDDGGAIYSWNNSNQTIYKRIWIENNIIINPIGNGFGTLNSLSSAGEGIYTDDALNHVIIKGNTIIGSNNYGLYLHNNFDMIVENNFIANNKTQVCIKSDALSSVLTRNNIFKNNTIINIKEDQRVLHLQTKRNDLDSLGLFDNNYYMSPFKNSLQTPIFTERVPDYPISETTQSKLYKIEEWIYQNAKEPNSKIAPVFYKNYTITDTIENNKIKNGSFDTNIANWTSWGSNGSVINYITDVLEGGAIALSFPANNTSSYVELNNPIDSLRKDSIFHLKFTAKASKSISSMEVRFLKNATPYTLNKILGKVSLSQNEKKYEYLLKSTLTEYNSRITFRIYPLDSLVWIDNVELLGVNGYYNNIVDSLLISINETSNNKIISLSNKYLDKDSLIANSSITLAPYSSEVLFFKEKTNPITKSLKNKVIQFSKIYPNPISIGEKLFYEFDEASRANIKIFNLQGLLLFEKDNLQNKGYLLPTLIQTGLYFLYIVIDGSVFCEKLLVQ